ncbi:MAG: HI0074 family nucleotidyltransferase substrate-binding subunit [Eubacterium sp.]|nr:HI0074 family nucleotidyltransferase substrate-binding subunit [Eubacterium sp.]
MKKIDNFKNSLEVLKSADYDMVTTDEIYRTGVIGQFNLTFELAWKALQQVMRDHGVEGAETGSPREILQLGYKVGFVDDETMWLTMLKKRNQAAHEYDEDELEEVILLIRDSFTGTFEKLLRVLEEKDGE